jgi:hypothetical protein
MICAKKIVIIMICAKKINIYIPTINQEYRAIMIIIIIGIIIVVIILIIIILIGYDGTYPPVGWNSSLGTMELVRSYDGAELLFRYMAPRP